MPDISMCEGKLCPAKNRCWRFLATPSFRQAYSDFDDDLKVGASQCAYFDDIWVSVTLTNGRKCGIITQNGGG
jgi:hypothetical protein